MLWEFAKRDKKKKGAMEDAFFCKLLGCLRAQIRMGMMM